MSQQKCLWTLQNSNWSDVVRFPYRIVHSLWLFFYLAYRAYADMPTFTGFRDYWSLFVGYSQKPCCRRNGPYEDWTHDGYIINADICTSWRLYHGIAPRCDYVVKNEYFFWVSQYTSCHSQLNFMYFYWRQLNYTLIKFKHNIHWQLTMTKNFTYEVRIWSLGFR